MLNLVKNLLQIIKNYGLCFALLCSSPVLQSQPLEEISNSHRPFTIEDSNYQPKTLEENLHYIQLYEFLSKNKQAFELLESAQKGGLYYQAAQKDFLRYLLNPTSNLREGLDLINNNSSLKAKAEIGAKISGIDAGITAELDLKGLAHDVWSRMANEDHNKRIRDTAGYYTNQTYTCVETPHLCLMNAQAHQRQAVIQIRQHFHDFPAATDQEGRLLSFEEKAENSSPEQLELASALFDASWLQNISSQLENNSAENEQNTEEILQNIEKTQEEIIQNKEAAISAINKHTQNFQEEFLREIERREQARRQNLKETDPDYMNEDPILLAARNNIDQWEREKEDLLEDLNQGDISQSKYDEEIKNIDRTIGEKRIDIEVYEFKKSMQKGMAWAGVLIASANIKGVPKEMAQLGQAVQAGMQAFDTVGSMIIAGAIDPTGITLALNSVSAVIQALSGTPSADQIIIDALNQLRKGQIQIFRKLNEIDHKLENIDTKINSIIEMLNMGHKQVTQKLDHITDELHRIENEIILAIEESKSGIIKEFQNSGAFFTDDGRVTLDILETWERTHLNQIALQCKSHKDQYDRTGHLRFYDDYNWCMDTARNQLSMITESLSDLYQKAKHRFGTNTYVQFVDIESLNSTQLISQWSSKVEERLGLLRSIFNWMDGFYSKHIRDRNEEVTKLWTNQQAQWGEDKIFIDSLEGSNIKHPRFYDEVLSVYAPLTEQLPLPEHLSFIMGMESKVADYTTKHLMDMCQNLKHIEDLSFYNRRHLEKAWWIYLYLSNQAKKGLDNLFEDTFIELLESYDENDSSVSSLTKTDCKCSSIYTQTTEEFTDYMSNQKQTDIFQYIYNQGYNVHDFLDMDSKEIARQASLRPHITDQYLVNTGFHQTVQGDCMKFPKPGDDSEDAKNVPYTEAEWEIEEQRTHYNDTLQKLHRENKCWITDTEGHIKNLSKGEQFQLEKYVSFKNVIGKEEKALRNMCLTSKRTLDTGGVGAIVGGIVGGIAGALVDVLALGTTVGSAAAGGATGGAALGSIIDGTESAFSLCETAELKQTLVNEGTKFSDLLSQSNFLKRVYYNKAPLTSYLQSVQIRTANIPEPVEIWPYHFVCKKRACLKFDTKNMADKEEWIQTAAYQIIETQNHLKDQLKGWFEKTDIYGNTSGSGIKLQQLLLRSALALDTMARAGYGQNLAGQPELSQIINSELANLQNNINRLDEEKIIKLVQNLRYLPNDQGVPALPLQPINRDTFLGLGNTKDREQALNIIINRNHFSPKECRDLKKERKR